MVHAGPVREGRQQRRRLQPLLQRSKRSNRKRKLASAPRQRKLHSSENLHVWHGHDPNQCCTMSNSLSWMSMVLSGMRREEQKRRKAQERLDRQRDNGKNDRHPHAW
jgi:hypothetical protein